MGLGHSHGPPDGRGRPDGTGGPAGHAGGRHRWRLTVAFGLIASFFVVELT